MDLKRENGYYWPDLPMKYGRYVASLASLEDVIDICPEKSVAVQAGGHCGVWPKFLAMHFDAVYTFEPDAHNFKALCANVDEANIFAARGALGAYPAFVGLHQNPVNTGGHWVEGAGFIPVYTIDQFHFKRLDLIVLDVEGSELAALQGAVRTIELCRPIIMFEDNGNAEFKGGYDPQEIYDLLKSLGYKQKTETKTDKVWVHD